MELEPFVQQISPRPLHSEVADRLRDLIAQGELAPGDRLNERLLTERFGISRTPLREAIKMLASEGLVNLLPNRGAVVTALTRDAALDMFQVLASLEALAGRLACERATAQDVADITSLHMQMRDRHEHGDLNEYIRLNQRIHQRIIETARNSELNDMHRRISVRLRRAHFMANYSKERWSDEVAEHERMLEAFNRRDGERLGELLVQHLQNKLKVVIDWLETHGGEGAAPAARDGRSNGASRGAAPATGIEAASSR